MTKEVVDTVTFEDGDVQITRYTCDFCEQKFFWHWIYHEHLEETHGMTRIEAELKVKKDDENTREVVKNVDEIYPIGSFAQIVEMQDLGKCQPLINLE